MKIKNNIEELDYHSTTQPYINNKNDPSFSSFVFLSPKKDLYSLPLSDIRMK